MSSVLAFPPFCLLLIILAKVPIPLAAPARLELPQPDTEFRLRHILKGDNLCGLGYPSWCAGQRVSGNTLKEAGHHQESRISSSDTCGNFGSYLCLVTCKRVCYYRYMERPEYLPLPLTLAKRETGLSSPRKLKKLPHVQTLPAPYNHQ